MLVLCLALTLHFLLARFVFCYSYVYYRNELLFLFIYFFFKQKTHNQYIDDLRSNQLHLPKLAVRYLNWNDYVTRHTALFKAHVCAQLLDEVAGLFFVVHFFCFFQFKFNLTTHIYCTKWKRKNHLIWEESSLLVIVTMLSLHMVLWNHLHRKIKIPHVPQKNRLRLWFWVGELDIWQLENCWISIQR